MEEYRLPKRVFLWDYNKNINKWCMEVQNIFDICNMLHIYESKTEALLELVNERLSKHFEEIWQEKCMSMPKLRTYVLHKNRYETETYVKMFMSRK